MTYLLAICGDGIIVLGYEDCDKVLQTVGCDAACNTETGFDCVNDNSSYGTCVGMLIDFLPLTLSFF
jgi:cysteine-rich repeat protein